MTQASQIVLPGHGKPYPSRTQNLHNREEIPVNLRITQTKDNDWVEHAIEKGSVSYSAQYSDQTEVYRHIRVSTRIFRDVQRILVQRPNRLLSQEDLTATLGIPMSSDWRHYHTHTRARVLLFKRPRRVLDQNNNK